MYLLVLCYYQILYDFLFLEKKSSFYPVKRTKEINSCWPWSKNLLCSSVDVTADTVNNSFVQTDQNCSDEDTSCTGLLLQCKNTNHGLCLLLVLLQFFLWLQHSLNPHPDVLLALFAGFWAPPCENSLCGIIFKSLDLTACTSSYSTLLHKLFYWNMWKREHKKVPWFTAFSSVIAAVVTADEAAECQR